MNLICLESRDEMPAAAAEIAAAEQEGVELVHGLGAKSILGQEYADQLEKEITKKDEPPVESIIKVAGNWLLYNIPEIAGALTDLFVNPVVGKVVQGAGRVASDWVKQKFGKAQKGK